MISSRIQVGFSTDTGKRRKNNQDAFLAENGVYMVFDGMGGGMGGERASKLAVDRFTRLSLRPFRTTHDISLTLADAQHAVLSLGEELKGVSGTTATGIVIPSLFSATAGTRSDNGTQRTEPDLWYVVNIGDSRTYHMKTRLDAVSMAETLCRITKDHSERQEAIDSGTVPPQIANATIPRNIITQCIGSPNGIHPDFFAVNASGRFIVCSDGLHSEVSDSEIGAIAQAHTDPQQAADALTNAALEAGGHDNITVIVVDTGTKATGWEASKLAPEEELNTLSDITLTGCHT